MFLGLNGIRAAAEEVLAEKQGEMNRNVARRKRRRREEGYSFRGERLAEIELRS